jgi:hypothetical protein
LKSLSPMGEISDVDDVVQAIVYLTEARRVGAELKVEDGRKAARLATPNGLAAARHHLGSLDKVTQIVRLGVSVATCGDVREQPKVADGASKLMQNVFGADKNPSRPVYGVARHSLGTPLQLEIVFEAAV